jgi:hypothetical protein
MSKNKKFILGVEGSGEIDLETGLVEYGVKILITKDVYDWLNAHDVEYTNQRDRIYICNNLRYVDLGPDIDILNFISTKRGEA